MVHRSMRPITRLWLAGAAFAVAAAAAPLLQPGASGARGGSLVPAEQVDAAEQVDHTDSVTLMMTGEILPHPSVVEHARQFGRATGRPFDFAPMFADLRPLLESADLAICHLEVPVAPQGAALSGYPAFGIPPEIGAGIRDGGWDRCSTASNHTNDKGSRGIVATLDALDAANVGHSGTARTQHEAEQIPLVTAHGVKVAHLSYTWGFNGTPPAQPWMANVMLPDRILSDAQRARAAGAALVIVSLHWGNEYQSAGSDQQRALAEQLLASPNIDLLVGTGPHVLQPIEPFHDKYALLSLGNLVSNQGASRPSTYDGAVVTVTFARGGDGSFHAAAPVVRPTWYDAAAGKVRLVQTALDEPGPRASLTRTSAVLGPYLVAIG